MSFVGPRPERPHFVEQLAQAIPALSRAQLGQAGDHRLGAGQLSIRRLDRGCAREACVRPLLREEPQPSARSADPGLDRAGDPVPGRRALTRSALARGKARLALMLAATPVAALLHAACAVIYAVLVGLDPDALAAPARTGLLARRAPAGDGAVGAGGRRCSSERRGQRLGGLARDRPRGGLVRLIPAPVPAIGFAADVISADLHGDGDRRRSAGRAGAARRRCCPPARRSPAWPAGCRRSGSASRSATSC